MKKLPKEVEKLFSASTRTHSYRRAVEELVYNAVDAGSTSIAIRLNLDDNCMQVIDNGCGMRKNDMKLVGLKHTTSKIMDLNSLKSTSNVYGYRGQALASIIEVSEEVKITSRWESEETMVKTYCCGNVEGISIADKRPSKGTTVEIKGFLYNLHIQKNNTDSLQEVQEIKQFLKQLSLVHNNISISLRDDSNNEIIFQVHKTRDIYQTLHTLFGINQSDCMELKAEKRLYKVVAYIGNKVSDENENHWFYLNGRTLKHSRLHNIFDDEMTKVLGLKNGKKKTSKLQFGQKNGENQLFKKNIPFYFIFITCPYNDYDLNYTDNKTILEFKNWDNITTLLEKLAKFYIGDVRIKKNEEIPEQNGKDTRDEVKKIVEKFLGNIAGKPGVSQMHNGVKGRLMKRNKTKKTNISLSKVIPDNSGKKTKTNKKSNEVKHDDDSNNRMITEETVKKPRRFTKTPKPIKENKIKTDKAKKSAYKKVYNDKPLKDKAEIKNGLVKLFEIDNSQVKRKCKQAADKANELMRIKLDRNGVDNRNSVQYCITQTDIRTVSMRNETQDVARDTEAFKKPIAQKRAINDVAKKEFRSNYDLLQAILKTQSDIDVNTEAAFEITVKDNIEQDYTEENKLTFQSHRYNIEERFTMGHKTVQTRRNRFITTESRENMASKHVFRRPRPIRRPQPYSKWNGKRRIFNFAQESLYTIEFNDTNKENHFDCINREMEPCVQNNILNTVFSQIVSGNAFSLSNTIHTVLEATVNHNEIGNIQNTYTIDILNSNEVNDHETIGTINELGIDSSKDNDHKTTREEWRMRNDTVENLINVEFISNTHNTNDEESLALEPLNVCETLLDDSNHNDRSKQDINSFNFGVISRESEMLDDGREDVDLSLHDVNRKTEIKTKNDMLSIPVQVPSTEDLIETSNYFQLGNTIEEELLNEFAHNFTGQRVNKSKEVSMETLNKSGEVYRLHKKSGMTFGGDNRRSKIGDFNMRDRPGFMPKGLSPIFEKCETKNACHHDLESEYFNDTMYNDFVKDIEQQTVIFEANIQNLKDLATKHIEKVNNKLKKDNASLSFDGSSLKNAIILGQVDCKFIAAKMKGNTNAEHLVLFDQHAVHERIRLENNMAEYLTNNRWKSVPLDEIVIKLKSEEIIYIHNFRHKFEQLGLKWTAVDDKLSVYGIPLAILGNNPRQVEVIMKAVKILIQEEIAALKTQKGSLCLYPKAIMDLVFSEACRYAIKFGDALSWRECRQLLQDLSACRAPFQCAHGRPAMAVLLDIATSVHEYKINYNKLHMFRDKFV